MTNKQFEEHYYPRYDGVIRAIARKQAGKKDDLAEDLYQEGLIALWKLDPSKAQDNEDAYIRQAVKFRMIDFIRKQKPALLESLNAHLERGEQLVQDEVTGEVRLISPHPRDRASHANDFTNPESRTTNPDDTLLPDELE